MVIFPPLKCIRNETNLLTSFGNYSPFVQLRPHTVFAFHYSKPSTHSATIPQTPPQFTSDNVYNVFMDEVHTVDSPST